MTRQLQSEVSLRIASRAFGASECAIYGDLSQDYNPIHSDKDFAAKTPFGHPIVFGFLFVMPVWDAIQKAFGEDAVSGSKAAIRFIRPLLVGQTAHYSAQLEQSEDIVKVIFTITAAAGDDPIAVVQLSIPAAQNGGSR